MKSHKAPLSFIIYTPPYDPNSGGAIVLYELCKLLSDLGHDSKIWLANKPLTDSNTIVSFFGSTAYWLWVLLGKKRGKYNGPVEYADKEDIGHSIVVYPETISGNPLNADHVVRWFLNRPGRLTGEVRYGENELFFYQHKQFNDLKVNPYHKNQLRILKPMTDVYRQTNFGRRSGSCYMVRKGDSTHQQVPAGSVKLDGMSHADIAEHFNRCEEFICFDLYTFYSKCAALCGCRSIVIPKDGISVDDWRPEYDRYGLAYGRDQLEYAESTIEALRVRLESESAKSLSSVSNFIQVCESYFSD